jgi:ADP-ribosylglycohydrolase
MSMPEDHDVRMRRALRCLEGLSVGDAFGEQVAGTNVYDVILRVGNGSRILAQDTVPFALWCACHHMDDYPRALWTAVSRFGDCDTLCAIVGGIVVMHQGESAIPEEWRQRREPLSAMLRID